MSDSQNEKAWQILFERHHIPTEVARHGSYRIRADTIKTVREPRLMAKFDEYNALPAIFRAHQLSILPLSRTEYIIGPFQTFHDLEYMAQFQTPKSLAVPMLDTLDATQITGEQQALSVLYHSGGMRDVCDDPQPSPVSVGRMGSGDFEFTIAHIRADEPPHTVAVHNAQIEIDAVYETNDAIFLCEAKNRHVHDINVRQLYYPYRTLRARTQKPIYPVTIIYTNYTFHVAVYEFADPQRFNSLVMRRQHAFRLNTHQLSWHDLDHIYAHTHEAAIPTHAHPHKDPKRIPFPQADDFDKIIRLLETLAQKPAGMHADDITDFLQYVERQTDYYANAGQYLGFINKDAHGRYQISAKGARIMKQPWHLQRREHIAAIFARPVFYTAARWMLQHRAVPTGATIYDMVQQHPALSEYNETTIRRRMQTVQGWLQWVYAQLSG